MTQTSAHVPVANVWKRVLVWAAVAVLAGVSVATAARTWALSPVQLTSNSMAPGMERGDWVVVSGLGAVEGRDVVLFRYPLGSTGSAVKRVVAIGGDTVAFTERWMSVNGRRATVAGMPPEVGPDGMPVPGPKRRVVQVPNGHVFLLGDNAAVSLDSRSFGTVPRSELVGRVRFTVPASSWSWAAVLGGGALACGLLVALRRLRPA
jgi:signal peptidase I